MFFSGVMLADDQVLWLADQLQENYPALAEQLRDWVARKIDVPALKDSERSALGGVLDSHPTAGEFDELRTVIAHPHPREGGLTER